MAALAGIVLWATAIYWAFYLGWWLIDTFLSDPLETLYFIPVAAIYLFVLFIVLAPELGFVGILYVGALLIVVSVLLMIFIFAVIGSIFVGFWALEALGVIEKNPIDHVMATVNDWFSTAMLLNEVRIPVMWLEYQVIEIFGADAFDYNNENFLYWFYFLAFPFVWIFMLCFQPFIILFQPIMMLIFYYDEDLIV